MHLPSSRSGDELIIDMRYKLTSYINQVYTYFEIVQSALSCGKSPDLTLLSHLTASMELSEPVTFNQTIDSKRKNLGYFKKIKFCRRVLRLNTV